MQVPVPAPVGADLEYHPSHIAIISAFGGRTVQRRFIQENRSHRILPVIAAAGEVMQDRIGWSPTNICDLEDNAVAAAAAGVGGAVEDRVHGIKGQAGRRILPVIGNRTVVEIMKQGEIIAVDVDLEDRPLVVVSPIPGGPVENIVHIVDHQCSPGIPAVIGAAGKEMQVRIDRNRVKVRYLVDQALVVSTAILGSPVQSAVHHVIRGCPDGVAAPGAAAEVECNRIGWPPGHSLKVHNFVDRAVPRASAHLGGAVQVGSHHDGAAVGVRSVVCHASELVQHGEFISLGGGIVFVNSPFVADTAVTCDTVELVGHSPGQRSVIRAVPVFIAGIKGFKHGDLRRRRERERYQQQSQKQNGRAAGTAGKSQSGG